MTQAQRVEITSPVTFRGREYKAGDIPLPGHADRLIDLGYAQATPPEKPATQAARKRRNEKES